MFRRKLNRILLVVVWVMFVCGSYAQVTPISGYSSLGFTNVSENGTSVCPSLYGTNDVHSTNTFRVLNNHLDAGGATYFQWVVFGGTIIGDNGNSPFNDANASTVEVDGNDIPYYYISHDQFSGGSGDYSEILVEWYDGDVTDAWVAVRQVSEWECTNGVWQVFTNDIYNGPPAFDVFPSDEIIAWGQRAGFVLTKPTNTDDGCPDPALLFMTVVVEDSDGTEMFSGDETDGSYNNFDWATLDAGVYTVTWSLTDGSKYADSQSHTVIIEPELRIENVAWTTDYCEGGNASVFVSQITDYAFTGDLMYSFDGGGSWQPSAFISGLSGDGTVYTVQAKLEYFDGHEEFSTEYSFTLPDMADIAIDGVLDPDIDPDDITLVPTDCGNTDDGQITMNPAAMIAQNKALQFNGSSDYLLVNKQYQGEINEFTVAAWVKTTSNDGAILSFDKDQYFQLEVSGGQLQLSATSTDNQNNTVLNDDQSYKLADGDWHLVVVTFGDNGADVVYDLYQDGIPVKTSVLHNGSNSIGKTGSENNRYGAIGAVLKSNTFIDAGQAYFFSGSIAEVGIWDTRLTSVQVIAMKRNGMLNTPIAPTDHFALNSIPSDVSASNPDIFSDVGNTQQTGTFARFYNASGLENDAPKLYAWNDDVTIVSTERSGLSSGAPGYTFSVSDIFGCGIMDNSADPYVIPNGDEAEPYLLWNVAIEKTATQSTLAGGDICGTPMVEGMAVDGDLEGACSYTETENEVASEPWWQVNLGDSYPVNRIRVHAHQDITDFDVLVAPTDFPAGDLADDWSLPGVVFETYSGTINAGGSDVITFPANTNGSYVRIRLHNSGEVLSLNEVEVLTRYLDTDTRKLYLTDDCTYTIDAFDATINPIPIDDCGQIPIVEFSYTDPQTSIVKTGNSLIGEVWNMDYYTVEWKTSDENGNEGYLTMTYEVVDEEVPVFNTNPFDGIPAELTWCDAQNFILPIPDVDDNQLTCNDLQSISLLRNNTTIYTVPNIDTYPTGTPDDTPVLSVNMLTGTYDYTWRVVDFSGNVAIQSITITTQQQPILDEVKYSPITCHDNNNGRVYFSQIDVESLKPITYILKSTTSPFTEYTHTDNEFTVSTGTVSQTDLGIVPANDTYQAWLEVDGCRTPTAYPEDIVISNPEELNTVNDITHVLCFGDSDGAIDMDPQGGNGSYALHLIGEDDPATYASAPSYTNIHLTEQGMIEAWVFIDTIANGGINWNAGIFGIPNAGNGYGLRIADGDLQFYVGSETVNVAIADPNSIERMWIHLRGEWNGSDVDNTPYLTIETSVGSNTNNPGVAFTAASVGNVYIGSLNDGNNDHNLRGFVRYARIWNSSTINAQTIAQNQYLIRPIDPDDNLVANYPMSTGTTTSSISNTVNTSQVGTVAGHYLRQPYAYYWVDPDGAYLTNEQDISGYSAGIYNVTLYDPYGCVKDFDIEIETRDEIAPVLNFYTDNARSNPLPMGDPIIRYTSSSDGGNVADNCAYIPYGDEFNPIILDGTCDFNLVTVNYDYVVPYPADYDLFVDPDGELGNDPSNLDTRELTGITKLLWTADDGANTSTKEITYYIVDDTPPTDPGLSDIYLSLPDNACVYEVLDNSLDPDPTTFDNCGTGILTNDKTGTSTLQGYIFDVNTHTVTWTYTDRDFPGSGTTPATIDFTQNIIVEDNTTPIASCKAAGDIAPLQLDINGETSIDYLDIDNGSGDNCVSLDALVITKDISDEIVGTDISIPQNNPWWQFELSSKHALMQLSLLLNVTINEYWVLISNNGNFDELNGDLTDPQWGTDVVYAEYYNSGDISGAVDIPINQIAEDGLYVRIWMIPTTPTIDELDIDIVEIFGTSDLSNATEFTFTCDDIRFIAGATVRDEGTFDPINILLSAIDENDNVGSCMTQVTVRDDVPPVVITANAEIEVHPDAGNTINLNDYIDQINNGTYDNCGGVGGIAEMWVTPEDLIDCGYIGSYPVTLHAVDQHGKQASRSATLNIVDGTGPNIAAYSSIELPIGPDGYYVVQPEDILDVVEDNCTDVEDLVYEIIPDTVRCSDIELGYIDLSITVTDAGNNSTTLNLLSSDEQVLVVDRLAPTFSLSDYTHIIPSSGSAPIFFDDIVKDGNLHDNCTAREDLLRYIRYDDANLDVVLDPDEWCGYGYEGGGSSAFENIADLATVTGSDALTGYSKDNVKDYSPAGYTTESNMTYFVSDEVAGERTIQYNFAKNFDFERIEALWVDIPSTDGNVLLSPDNTTTNTSPYWIEYEYNEPIMVANVRLKWNAGSQLSGDTQIEYWDEDNASWDDISNIGSIGIIENNDEHTTIAIIDATESINRIRLSYTPASGTPTIDYWRVYGQACTPYAGREVVSTGSSPGEILVSHNWDYLQSVSDINDDTDVVNVNDTDNESTVFRVDPDPVYYVQYDFYDDISLTSTEVYWRDLGNNNGVYYPDNTEIQIWNGTGWDIYNIGDNINNYQVLDLTGITTSRIRLSFEDRGYDVEIANWRVYGTPCETVSIPSSEILNLSNSFSTGVTITSSSELSSTFADDNASDGTTAGDPYRPDNLGQNGNHWIQYDFSEEILLTSYQIDWITASWALDDAETYYWDGSAWVLIVDYGNLLADTYTYNSSSISAQSFRVEFQGGDDGAYILGVEEWTITGYPLSAITSSGCWETQPATLYNCPTVTTQLPVIAPNNAYVQYSNDGGSSWSSQIVVGTTDFPTGVNNTLLDGGNPVEANALRLTFDNTLTEGNIGLYEFRTFGRRIPQIGDETVASACYTHDCDDVQQDHDVYLRAVDESGNEGIENVTVLVEPYFDILQLEIKDCGYDGERYYPLIAGLEGTQTYEYIWSEVEDHGQPLFYYPNQYRNSIPDWDFPYSTGEDDNIDFATYDIDNATRDYEVKLRTQDLNGCFDTINYEFRYDGANTVASSIKEREACINQEVTYDVRFPDQFSFFYDGSLDISWYDEDGSTPLADNANFDVSDGGVSGETYVTGTFLTSTVSRGGVTTDIIYGYRVQKLHFDIVEDIVNHGWDVEIKNAAGDQHNWYDQVIRITGEVQPGGPYWINSSGRVNYEDINEGDMFIRSNNLYTFGDYARCLETAVFKTTVFEVIDPIIEATYDAVPDASSTWYTITGSGAVADFDVCVRDTITYRVQNYSAAQFAYLDWNFESEHAEPVPTGRRLAGGNSYDQTITMVWDIYDSDVAYQPRLKVRGYNDLDCTGNEVVVTHEFTDITPPVIADYAVSANFPADPVENEQGQCGRMFTNIPPPIITDDCGRTGISRIQTYWCDIDFNSDGTADISGRRNAAAFYPVGEHTVTWYAVDYSGNTSEKDFILTVLDTEAPNFDFQPGPVGPLYTSVSPGGDCSYIYAAADPNRNVGANDVCEGVISPVANIYLYDIGTSDYTIHDLTQQDLTTLVGAEFPVGDTKVIWTANDGVDNSAYTGYTADGNESEVEFIVTVVDDTPPTVDDVDGGKAGIQLAPITVNTNPEQQGATFNVIVGPDYSGPTPVTDTDYTLFYPGYDNNADPIDPDGIITDNCNEDFFSVVFVSRTDGEDQLSDEFPVGSTTIIWRIFDFAGNWVDVEQDINVTDNQAPEFRDNIDATVAEDFADRSITYCLRENYRIPIPRTYWDNVQVEELTYTVENITTGTTILTGSLLYANTPNFTVGGVPYLTPFNFDDPGLAASDRVDAENGTDYTITWTAIDGAIPTPFSSASQSYNLRIEMQPRFNHATTEPIDCGGDQARITIDVSPGATIAESMDLTEEHYIRYEGYPKNQGDDGAPEFNIGTGWQESPVFDFNVSGNNEYTVRMRVNGCEAPEQITVNIVAPEAVLLDTEVKQHASCPETFDAAVSVSMSGGVPGQPHFTASLQNFSVADYNEIDLTAEGAIEAWVYFEEDGSATIVNKGTAYGLKVNYDGGSEEHHFAVFVDGNELESTYPVTTNRWYHVSGWWDASNLSIRVDEQTADNQSGTYIATSNNDPLTIGGNNFFGIIREVRLWDLTVAGNAFANGAIPTTKFRGDETGLVGFWDMGEGQGDAANKRVGFGNDAVPSTTAIWEDNLPLPGFYTWERKAPEALNYQAYPLPSDSSNLNLQGLEIGSYQISFIDHYGCAAANTSFKKLIAVDDKLPEYVYPSTSEWTGVKVATIYTDEDVCTATLNTQALAGAYTPEVTDEDCGDCEFESNWRVVYTPTNELLFNQDYHSSGIDQALVSAVLKNQAGDGTNIVRITVEQNGLDNIGTPEEYTINLIDDQKPVPIGKFGETINLDLDNTPDGGGQVTLAASDFDNGSTDNCTKDPDLLNPRLAAPSPDQITNGVFNPDNPVDPLWLEEASFGCAEVGNTVTLYYMVTDESGNSEWTTEASEIVVTDPHAPVFQTTSSVVDGECATVNADTDNNIPAYTLYGSDYPANDISLDPADFTDNCQVVHARFKLKYLWDGDMTSGTLDYTNDNYDTFGYPAFDAGDPTTWELHLNPTVDSNGDFIEYYDGTTEVYFELTDKSGNQTEQLVYTVIVLPKPTPGGIE